MREGGLFERAGEGGISVRVEEGGNISKGRGRREHFKGREKGECGKVGRGQCLNGWGKGGTIQRAVKGGNVGMGSGRAVFEGVWVGECLKA